MSRPARRFLLRNSLTSLIVLDLLALAALVADQWLGIDPALAWGVAALVAPPLFVLSRPLSDAVLAMADRFGGIPDTGEKIPGVGQ